MKFVFLVGFFGFYGVSFFSVQTQANNSCIELFNTTIYAFGSLGARRAEVLQAIEPGSKLDEATRRILNDLKEQFDIFIEPDLLTELVRLRADFQNSGYAPLSIVHPQEIRNIGFFRILKYFPRAQEIFAVTKTVLSKSSWLRRYDLSALWHGGAKDVTNDAPILDVLASHWLLNKNLNNVNPEISFVLGLIYEDVTIGSNFIYILKKNEFDFLRSVDKLFWEIRERSIQVDELNVAMSSYAQLGRPAKVKLKVLEQQIKDKMENEILKLFPEFFEGLNKNTLFEIASTTVDFEKSMQSETAKLLMRTVPEPALTILLEHLEKGAFSLTMRSIQDRFLPWRVAVTLIQGFSLDTWLTKDMIDPTYRVGLEIYPGAKADLQSLHQMKVLDKALEIQD